MYSKDFTQTCWLEKTFETIIRGLFWGTKFIKVLRGTECNVYSGKCLEKYVMLLTLLVWWGQLDPTKLFSKFLIIGTYYETEILHEHEATKTVMDQYSNNDNDAQIDNDLTKTIFLTIIVWGRTPPRPKSRYSYERGCNPKTQP